MFQYRQPLLVLVVGLASLTFRQTNIFWVALFLGGLELTKRVPRAKAGRAFAVGKTKGSHQTSPTIVDVVTESWKSGELYDPLLQDAWLEGMCSPHVMSF